MKGDGRFEVTTETRSKNPLYAVRGPTGVKTFSHRKVNRAPSSSYVKLMNFTSCIFHSFYFRTAAVFIGSDTVLVVLFLCVRG